MNRRALPTCPFASARSIFSFRRERAAAGKAFTPRPLLQSISSASAPSPVNAFFQSAVAAASAGSARLSTISRGLLPTMRSTSGLRLELGMRASRSSTTASTRRRLSSIMRVAFFI